MATLDQIRASAEAATSPKRKFVNRFGDALAGVADTLVSVGGGESDFLGNRMQQLKLLADKDKLGFNDKIDMLLLNQMGLGGFQPPKPSISEPLPATLPIDAPKSLTEQLTGDSPKIQSKGSDVAEEDLNDAQITALETLNEAKEQIKTITDPELRKQAQDRIREFAAQNNISDPSIRPFDFSDELSQLGIDAGAQDDIFSALEFDKTYTPTDAKEQLSTILSAIESGELTL